MENNFVDVVKREIEEMHEFNLETMEDLGCTYAECFPLYFTRKVVIDGKEYCLATEMKLKEI